MSDANLSIESARSRIIFKNEVDDPRCILSTTGTLIAPVTMPLSNLQNADRSSVVRINSASAFSITGTYSSGAIGASGFGVFRHNLTSESTVQLLGYQNSDATGTLMFDSGVMPGVAGIPLGSLFFGVDPIGFDYYASFYGPKQVFGWFPLAACASWQLNISDSNNPAGYVEICRLVIGQRFELRYNPDYGMKVGWLNNSNKWRTDGATIHVDRGDFYRELSFDLKAIPEDDRIKWMDGTRFVGDGLDFMICVYPEGSEAQKRDYTMNAYFDSIPKFTSNIKDHDATSVILREA